MAHFELLSLRVVVSETSKGKFLQPMLGESVLG